MIDLEFCGFTSWPGNSLGECLDAAGVDASVGHHVAVDVDAPEFCREPAGNHRVAGIAGRSGG
jgi:hypothetical protein